MVPANHRYASSLATEASSSCSEPDSAAELSQLEAGTKQSINALASAQATAAGSFHRKDVPAEDKAGSVATRAEAASPYGGLLKRKAGSDVGRARSGLQAQLRVQHPFTPLSGKLQHAPFLADKTALQHSHSPANLHQHQLPRALLDEESHLLASLQRLDTQLAVSQRADSVSGHVPQPACVPEVQSEASVGHRKLSTPTQYLRLQSVPAAVPKLNKQGFRKAGDCAPGQRKGSSSKGTLQEPSGRARRVAAERKACSSVLSPEEVRGRMRGRGRKQSSPNSRAAYAAVGINNADVNNSAEQQLLQSSLARLDSRLSTLASRCGGNATCCTLCISIRT